MENIIMIICAIFASTGFWTFISGMWQERSKKNTTRDKILIGLAHDRICHLGEKYIHDGKIKREDYENLIVYLYEPYRELGGNGTAEKIANEVKKLPIYTEDDM